MSRRGLHCVLGLVLVLVLSGCSRLRAPSENGSLVFSHSQHTEQADCGDCHAGIDKDQGGPRGKFIPGKAKCGECHEEALKDRGKCSMCHRGARAGVRFRREDRKLTFSHASHAGRVKDCATCHPKGQQGGASIPGHATCASADCHRSAYRALRCSGCHQDLSRFREKAVAGLSHGPGFVREHGTLARQATEACAQCHDQTYCAECHARTTPARPAILFPERVDRGFIHRGDFLSRHFVEARSAPQSCKKCHGQQHCRSCHAMNGLAVATHEDLRVGRSRSYHPAGWTQPGSGSFHGHRARQDIGRCASCHDRGAQSNCVSCHKVGGLGGNPHPPGWSWRDKSTQCRQNSMCATCHAGGQGCR